MRSSRIWAFCAVLVCWLALFTCAAECKTIYVSPTGADTKDGLSWASARATITAGLYRATSGDEIWVAKGTYAERITLVNGAALYGGFAGNETSRDQRDSRTNTTIIDAGQSGSVVTCPSSAVAGTVIDGFTIRNGRSSTGGGVYCGSASYVTISNNVITTNASTGQGGGIACSSGAPRIVGNVIRSNSASSLGGAVYVSPSCLPATTLAGNIIVSNRGSIGAGICYANALNITNNTILGNRGKGIHCMGYTGAAPAAISNNIIAYNLAGIFVPASQVPVMRNNCVYNPDGINYSGVSAGTGDISADPVFVGWEYGDYRIQPGSPCRDAGWNGAPEIGVVDFEGQARVQPMDGTVDIGADESDGLTHTSGAVTVRVSPSGDDANNGSSWALAKKTVQAGINAAPSGEVWVAAGVYNERITLKSGVFVYGGFVGTETTRDARNWKANETILDGSGVVRVVTASSIGLRLSGIDGFTIRNGSASTGAAIYCSDAGIVIANNKITANTATDSGGAIYTYLGSPVIYGNRIIANGAPSGAAIYCDSSTAIISNNVISANVSTAAFSWSTGGMVCCTGSSAPILTNNTLTGSNDFALLLGSTEWPVVCNNIFAFNYSAIYSAGASSTGPTTMRNNCIYGPTYVYPAAGTNNINTDPMLAGWQAGDFHIQPDSPCRNIGANDAAGIGLVDMDGQPRIQGGNVDIGADESDGTEWAVNAVITRVSPDGDDANDGSSWASAKKTVQAGIGAAMKIGGEVWVKGGVYSELIKPDTTIISTNGRPGYAYLYGGFAGTETLRGARDFKKNETILDGGGQGSVVTTPGLMTIDGFTIRNGKAESGGGIYCSSSVTICNNVITGNVATKYGGGVYCPQYYAHPNVLRNRILGNSAVYGGGIAALGCSAWITNNFVVRNKATQGSGGILCQMSSGYEPALISGNVIMSNTMEGIGMTAYGSSAGGTIYVFNNTILDNTSSGIQASGSVELTNNIVAYNGQGLNNATYGTITASNNCFYNPGATEVYPTAITGYTRVDPKLADGWWQNGLSVHIQPDSPCRDAGLNSWMDSICPDIDGQPRVQNGTVDIGADESDGTTWNWTYTPSIIRVSPNGSDDNDGSSWDKAKKTIQAAIDAANPTGGEVWVAAGTYHEQVILRRYVFVYGGFSGNEKTRDSRNWKANKTIIYAGPGTYMVVASGLDMVPSAIDGFSIIGYKRGQSRGITCTGSSPTIAHNTITGHENGGILCFFSSPTICDNNITGNGSIPAAITGIGCLSSSPVITRNLISENYISGISLAAGSCPVITDNVIRGNTTGIDSTNSSATICGNTFSQNASYAINVSSTLSAQSIISNNILAFTTFTAIRGGSTCVLRNNNLYNPGATNYSGLSKGVGDISKDPLFLNRSTGNYHLSAASPCINAGWNDAPGISALDMDGQTRIHSGTVDIGADEWWAGVADAKKTASGSIGLSAITVSAAFTDFFYVESDDRSSGIRVDKPGHTVNAGMRVDVDGTSGTNSGGEAVITATSVTPNGIGYVAPLAVTNRTLGGGSYGLQGSLWGWALVKQPDMTFKPEWLPAVGVNNVGLLVRIWGRVTYSGDGFFYIDDGSGLDDGSGHKGVKVYGSVPVDPGVDPAGKLVFVTGISSCEKPDKDPVRVVRTRGTGDVSLAAP